MGIHLVNECDRRQFTSRERTVLRILCNNASDETNECGSRVTNAWLSWITDLHEDTCRKLCKELRGAGVLEVTEEKTPRQGFRYRVHLSKRDRKQPWKEVLKERCDKAADRANHPVSEEGQTGQITRSRPGKSPGLDRADYPVKLDIELPKKRRNPPPALDDADRAEAAAYYEALEADGRLSIKQTADPEETRRRWGEAIAATRAKFGATGEQMAGVRAWLFGANRGERFSWIDTGNFRSPAKFTALEPAKPGAEEERRYYWEILLQQARASHARRRETKHGESIEERTRRLTGQG